MYESQTEEVIKQRMLGRISTDIDKSEGSFANDAVAPVSVELAQSYIQLERLLALAFAQTSSGTYLDMRAGEYGISRIMGSRAAGSVRFTGNNGVTIPVGTQIQTSGGLIYTTAESGVLTGGILDLQVTAEDIGIKYNVPAGSLIQLPVQVVGITGVTNIEPITGGSDIESDQSLLQRLLIKVRMPSTSGNANDYKLWALSVGGIGDAKVFPVWDGPGTVKVIVIDTEKRPANVNLVSSVSAVIENNRPIGAKVDVDAAQPLVIDINVTVVKDFSHTLEQIEEEVVSKVSDYLKSIAFRQSYVSYAQVGNAIMQCAGIEDYSNLSVNDGSANLTIGAEEVAIVGTVTVNE